MKPMPTISALLVLLGATAAGQVAVPGDVNGDGVVNVADHAYVQAILQRRLAATPAADVDGDGDVTERDAVAVADLIVGQPPFLYLGSGEIPQAGGELSVGDLNLAAAAGALPETARVVVTAATTAAPFEGDDDSPLYRIDGVPTRYGAGLTVSLPLASAGRAPGRDGTVLLEVGAEVSIPSSPGVHRAMSVVEARVEEGRLVADVPLLDLPPAGRDEETPDTQVVFVRRVTGVGLEELDIPDEEGRTGTGTRLGIRFPYGTPKEEYQYVIDAFARANILLHRWGFSPSDRKRRVDVRLEKLQPGLGGAYVSMPQGVEEGYIQISISDVLDPLLRTSVERTVFHEYFHLVQAKFDPRSSYTQAKWLAPTLWFNEACSVWFEKYAAAGTTSPKLAVNGHAVLRGHHMDCGGLAFLNTELHTQVENHGYGMVAMFEFLFHHPDAPDATRGRQNEILIAIYRAIRNGTEMRQAFLENVPPVTQWWDKMLATLVDDQLGRPIVSFSSLLTQPGARATIVKFKTEYKAENPLLLPAPSLGDCESWAFMVNWKEPGAKSKRRLILETAAPDNALYTVAFHSRHKSNPFAADGVLFGKYGDSYVSWIALPMEPADAGTVSRPVNYLLLRHFGEPPASGSWHTTRAWYVDPERQVKTTGTALDPGLEPKLIAYSATGSATCEDTLFPGELKVYRDSTLTQEVDRGGASFLVPNDGAFDTKFSVRIDGDIAPESIYKINRYRLRAYYKGKNGETREQILGTYGAPTTNINRTVTLGPDDEYVSVSVYADEELKEGEILPNKTYSLRSWFHIGLVVRCEHWLVARYGERAGGRKTAAPRPGTPCQTVVRQRDGTLTTADRVIYTKP